MDKPSREACGKTSPDIEKAPCVFEGVFPIGAPFTGIGFIVSHRLFALIWPPLRLVIFTSKTLQMSLRAVCFTALPAAALLDEI